MKQMREVSLDELEKAVGGSNEGGYARRPREKGGYFIYKIQSGDRLDELATTYGTTVDRIMRANPELINRNFILAGHYIYIPN